MMLTILDCGQCCSNPTLKLRCFVKYFNIHFVNYFYIFYFCRMSMHYLNNTSQHGMAKVSPLSLQNPLKMNNEHNFSI